MDSELKGEVKKLGDPSRSCFLYLEKPLFKKDISILLLQAHVDHLLWLFFQREFHYIFLKSTRFLLD